MEKRTCLAVFTCGFQGAGLVTVGSLLLLLNLLVSKFNVLFSWIDTVTLLRKFNNDILVSVWVGPDGKNSDDFIVQFDQSDLLLPSIDYYKLGAAHPIIKVGNSAEAIPKYCESCVMI